MNGYLYRLYVICGHIANAFTITLLYNMSI